MNAYVQFHRMLPKQFSLEEKILVDLMTTTSCGALTVEMCEDVVSRAVADMSSRDVHRLLDRMTEVCILKYTSQYCGRSIAHPSQLRTDREVILYNMVKYRICVYVIANAG